MKKLMISLSKGVAPGQKVSSQDVKSAKSILKAATRQQLRDSKASYKEVAKQLDDVRSRKEKDTAKLSAQIEKLQSKLEKVSARYDSRIERLTSRRDKMAQKAGIASPLPSPRASVHPTKDDKSDKPDKGEVVEKKAHGKPHNVVLPSKSKVKPKQEEQE